MAGAERMTIEEVVRKVLRDEHADVIRESVTAVAQELMDAEVSKLIGARLGERTDDRATHRNGYRPRRWNTRAGEIELQTPSSGGAATSRASCSRAGAPSRRSSRSSSKPTCAASPPAASTSSWSRSGCGSRALRCRGSRRCSTSRSRRSGSARSSAATRICSSTPRSRRSETRAACSAQVRRRRARGARVGRREIIGSDVGATETEAFWRAFLRGLVARGSVGVRLAVSDAHPGLEAALAQVLGAPGSAAPCTSLETAWGTRGATGTACSAR